MGPVMMRVLESANSTLKCLLAHLLMYTGFQSVSLTKILPQE